MQRIDRHVRGNGLAEFHHGQVVHRLLRVESGEAGMLVHVRHRNHVTLIRSDVELEAHVRRITHDVRSRQHVPRPDRHS